MAKPIMPAPSGDDIANLFNQIAAIKRQSSQLTLNQRLQTSQLGANRNLYLQQLADTFGQQRSNGLMDFAARGLYDSGIAHEGIARMQNVYGGQQAAYETGYRQQLASLAQSTQGQQADLIARRQALETAYNRSKAQKAAQLKLAGFGG
jgi:hypothetical protein